MCGLAGVAALGGRLDDDAGAVAAAMSGCLHHRGPDASGGWSDHRVTLSHRRLAILDLSEAGSQPMVSASGQLVVTFNGEIYNYRELGRRLAAEGWQPRGSSDTEVLLAAVEAWGLDRFLERADGMFAFALYDRPANRVILARDRFGEKPLAYARHQGRLYFASELRSFTQVPGLDLALDPAATASYFRSGYVGGGATIYAGVQRLAPGSVLEVDLTGERAPTERVYWRPPARRAAGSAPRVTDRDELHELLSRSVRDRLVSDRPLGAFLSGGVDSSLVCALAATHVSGPLKTFTMGWEDREYDESQQAARVASALGADHHDVRLGRSDVVEAVERLGQVMDEPFADSSLLATYLVASAAREHVVVALSGDGADELFAGYNRHRWLLKVREAHRRVPQRVRVRGGALADRAAPLAELVLRPIPPTRRPRLVADKVRKLAHAVAASSIDEAYHSLLAHDTSVGVARPLAPEVVAALQGDRDDVLWALRVADLCSYLPDDILTKVDRATMAVSLESRTPFLHPDVAAFALGLGVGELLGPAGSKQPLRALLAQLVPTVEFNQSKMGFGVPFASLLRNELRQKLADAVATHVGRRPPVGPNWEALHVQFVTGDDSSAPMLWSLLVFEVWAAAHPLPLAWVAPPS